MKATEGTEFVDPCCDTFYQEAKRLGRKLGVYHFATGNTSGEREAAFFLKHVKGYIGEAVLVLDWEAKALQKGTGYAKEFLDYVYKNTGVRPFIYMSKSVCRRYDWSEVAKDYKLWVAQYANSRKTGYQQNPWTDGKGYGAWESPAIFQYSSSGKVGSYPGNLDLNVAYLDQKLWDQCAGKSKCDNSRKTLEELAEEVILGRWGHGASRKRKLSEAGYDYEAVQKLVNEKLLAFRI